MPIPVGQSCSNCQYFVALGGLAGHCVRDVPSLLRFLKDPPVPPKPRPPWPPVRAEWWCGYWAPTGVGVSGLLPTDAGIGYRGTDDTGTTVALDTNWTLLQPVWASVTNAANFDIPSTGLARLNYTTYTPAPTYEAYSQANGIVTFTSGTANEDMEITFGVNSTPLPEYKVRVGFKNIGVSVAVPIVAGLVLKDQNTIGIYARSPTTANATYRDYHLLLESFKVIAF